ncbi:MFS transporter (plasmid) [Agrobacterium leguminum]|uniref:MFS transporter n=1 Tax=Agrobacterium leguminum TaxID=2792015 RepID=UPI0030CBE876
MTEEYSANSARQPAELSSIMRAVIRRIIPLLLICYIFSFMDRINVGFAQLQMKRDLEFSDAVYGLGAGLFFIGYFLFEVPSNMWLERIGARKTMLRIMVLWGLTSAAMMFVKTPAQFYVLRVLLGVFEAGFFPGIMLYLTFWTPAGYRGRVNALFMSALVATGMIAGPVSGFVLQAMDGLGGLHGWQWMFLLEGLPSCVLGVLLHWWLDDRPEDAKWLTPAEKRVLNEAVGSTRDNSHGTASSYANARKAFTSPLVYLFSLVYFALLAGANIITFWMPLTIRELGISSYLDVGLYSAVPYAIAWAAMILFGKSSDAYNEQRWHIAAPAFAGIFALSLLPLAMQNFPLAMALLIVATVGLFSTFSPFWTLATTRLSRAESAAGIAIITSVGNLAGFVSPFIIGMVRTHTGSMTGGIYLMGAIVVAGMIVLILGTRHASRDVKLATLLPVAESPRRVTESSQQ